LVFHHPVLYTPDNSNGAGDRLHSRFARWTPKYL
jgi:hypothetical protein